jgi:DNA adenine methylase
MTKPFLKWVGGKSRLLDRIPLPSFTGRYFEPFLGGGAMFFSIEKLHRPWLSDTNEALIRCYEGVRDHVADVIAELQGLPQTREAYESIREGYLTPARFIYVNKLGYNGVWRVNRAGKVNVPFGKKTNLVWDIEGLHAASRALQGAILHAQPFENTLCFARPGDLVFCDPPYLGTYAAYTAKGFTEADHARLARCAATLVAKRNFCCGDK